MRTLIILFLVCCFTNCSAQTPKSKKMQLSDKEIKEKGYQIKKEDTILMKNGTLDIKNIINNGNKYSDGTFWDYQKTFLNNIQVYISGNTEDGLTKKVSNSNDFLTRLYTYNKLGKLKQYGAVYPSFFKKDIWYWYDEDGNIEKYENQDTPYEFNWEDIQEFLHKKEIKKEEITKIHRSNLTGQYQWEIIYKPKEFLKTDNVKVLTLDAKTGEILKTEVRNISRQLD